MWQQQTLAARQVVLLLKSSDRIAHDLCHAFDGCASRRERPPCACLALRKFYDLRPGREFRCFMRNHELVGKRKHSQVHDVSLICKRAVQAERIKRSHPMMQCERALPCSEEVVQANFDLLLPVLQANKNGAACTYLLNLWDVETDTMPIFPIALQK